jgi:hypothetical protein
MGSKKFKAGDHVNESHMRSYYKTYNSEDPEALAAFYHEDVEVSSATGVLHGIDAVLSTYREIISNFYDKMTPSYIAIKNGQATVNIFDRFTAKCDVDDFMGQSFKTGDSFSLHLTAAYEFLDGKICKIEISINNS